MSNHDGDMPTFAEDILDAAGGEPIEGIIICQNEGVYLKRNRFKGDDREIPEEKCERLMSWDDARPLLDYKYDDGFGWQDCHVIYAWTPNRVLFVHEYDGSTSVFSVPRNPTDKCIPRML